MTFIGGYKVSRGTADNLKNPILTSDMLVRDMGLTFALKDAVAKKNLALIKFLCDKHNRDHRQYLYSKLNPDAAKRLAIDLGDLEGIKYIYDRFPLTLTFNEYTYPNSTILKDNRDLASLFLDLNGLKFIFNRIGGNYLKLYMNPMVPLIKHFIMAIQLDDFGGIVHIINHYKAASAFLIHGDVVLIKEAYFYDRLEIAELLIRKGSIFKPMYLIRTKLTHAEADYYGHLNKIKIRLAAEAYTEAIALIKAQFTLPAFTMSRGLHIFNTTEIIASNTYLDEPKEFVRASFIYNLFFTSSDLGKNILRLVAYTEIYSRQMKILLINETNEAHFQMDTLASPYKEYYTHASYASDSFESIPFLIHEFAHFVCYLLFNNEANPYTAEDEGTNSTRYQDYQHTMRGFLEATANFISDKGITAGMSNTDIILHLRKNSKFKRADHYWSKLSFAEKSANHEAYILVRIYDFLERDHSEWARELIVRLPEVYMVVENIELLSLFDPLKAYWDKHIIPEIMSRLQNQNLKVADQIKHAPNGDWLLVENLVPSTDPTHIETQVHSRCLVLHQLAIYHFRQSPAAHKFNNSAVSGVHNILNNMHHKCLFDLGSGLVSFAPKFICLDNKKATTCVDAKGKATALNTLCTDAASEARWPDHWFGSPLKCLPEYTSLSFKDLSAQNKLVASSSTIVGETMHIIGTLYDINSTDVAHSLIYIQ